MNRRDMLKIAGLGAAGALLPACGATLPEPDVSVAGFGEGASGTVRLWCRSATRTGVEVVVQRFNQAHDRLRVELTPVLDSQYVTKLATAIRGRRVPDVVDIDDINSMLFLYRDALTDITPVVDALPYRSKLSPGHLRLATRDGRLYAVPFLADNSALFYNRELLDRAGVDPERSLSSFDGYLDAARRVRALGPEIYGWSIAGNSPGVLGFVVQPHIWAADARTIAGDVGAQTGDVAGNAVVRRTLELYRTMWQEGLLPKPNFADAATAWGSDFRAGTVGLFPANYAVAVLSADDKMRARTGVVLMAGPDGGQAFFDGGDNFAIPRGAQNPSGAWEFIRFALDPAQQAVLPTGGYTPVRSDVATADFRRKFPQAVAPLDRLGRGYAPPTLAYNLLYNQPDSPFIAMFRRAVFDGDVDGALKAGQVSFDRILKLAQL
ncbi:sugar ABC transporter substrate-binding protein [Actinoplanes sp. NPDC051411]|uniref:ABC transporter substrate-binding protein n=1 Tax=Actinoplanes sp. NPDC051411 TaxID=3155522 RepID=UPI00343B3234